MLYISDIYNVETKEHFKSLDPNTKSQLYYCVELRDFMTGQQVALCRPAVVLEDKYRQASGVVTSNRLQVLERSFIDLLWYIDVKIVNNSNLNKKNLLTSKDLYLKNTDCLWYVKATTLGSGNTSIKYLNLLEFLVELQNQFPNEKIYGVGERYVALNRNGVVVIKIIIEKDLTVPITKYMIRRKK